LELAMLRTAMNLQDTVHRLRAQRSRPYLVSNTPNLLRTQI
jgi:Flp pilus assembly CpaE family ATPase